MIEFFSSIFLLKARNFLWFSPRNVQDKKLFKHIFVSLSTFKTNLHNYQRYKFDGWAEIQDADWFVREKREIFLWTQNKYHFHPLLLFCVICPNTTFNSGIIEEKKVGECVWIEENISINTKYDDNLHKDLGYRLSLVANFSKIPISLRSRVNLV